MASRVECRLQVFELRLRCGGYCGGGDHAGGDCIRCEEDTEDDSREGEEAMNWLKKMLWNRWIRHWPEIEKRMTHITIVGSTFTNAEATISEDGVTFGAVGDKLAPWE